MEISFLQDVLLLKNKLLLFILDMRDSIHKWLFIPIFLLVCKVGYTQVTWIPFDNSPIGTTPTITVIKSTDTEYDVQITFHGIYTENIQKDDKLYNKIAFGDGYSTLDFVGCPALPKLSQNIALPNDSHYTCSATKKDSLDIAIGEIFPFVGYVKENEAEKFAKIDSVYNLDVFKSMLINESGIQKYKHISNLYIDICPFKYYPKKNKLTVYSKVLVRIDFEKIGKKSIHSYGQSYKKSKVLFDNTFDFSQGKESVETQNASNNYDYLIIVGDKSELFNSNSIKLFSKWKAYKGLKTKIVSTSDIGNSCSAIKNYIKNEYNNCNIQYVLFVGDDDKIPLYDWTASTGGNKAKSDYWYGCMDGDDDYQADIAIGRFSTSDLSELDNMINKTIAYESTKNIYAQNVLLAAHKEYAPQKYQECSEDIRNASYTEPMSFTKAYGASTSKGGTNATNSNVIQVINSGVNIVNYRGHGNWDRWADSWSADNKGFTNSDVLQLTNTTYPVVFSIACLNADFRNQTCLMESFMRSEHGSSVFLGATEASYTYPNHTYDKLLFDNLLNNNIYNIGDLNIIAHIKNISNSSTYAITNAFCYVCGGDPSLEIFTQPTKTFDNVTISKNGNSLKLKVGSLKGFSVSVVSSEGTLIGVYSTQSNVINLSNIPSDAHLVLNKHNYVPYDVPNNTLYIQNENVLDDKSYTSDRIEVGYDVTTTKQYGNVTIKNGGSLTLKANYETLLKDGFECENGAELIIK